VRNCIGFADLLCAYADGELPESNRQSVEDHLAICDNCSAVLKIYKEITNSVNETNVPAPDALSIGVMNRIKYENVPRPATVTKQKMQYRKILTRYAPIAACLIVTLLVWQFWGDMFGGRGSESAPLARNMTDQAAPAATTGAGGSVADLSAVMAESAESDLEYAEAEAAGGFPDEEPSADGDTRMDYNITDDEDGEFWFHIIDGFDIIYGEIAQYINNSYAVISIIGNMPVFLINYQPVDNTSWDDWWIQSGWDELYEIPSIDIPILINELAEREGVEIVHNHSNVNNNTVLVVFSRGA